MLNSINVKRKVCIRPKKTPNNKNKKTPKTPKKPTKQNRLQYLHGRYQHSRAVTATGKTMPKSTIT